MAAIFSSPIIERIAEAAKHSVWQKNPLSKSVLEADTHEEEELRQRKQSVPHEKVASAIIDELTLLSTKLKEKALDLRKKTIIVANKEVIMIASDNKKENPFQIEDKHTRVFYSKRGLLESLPVIVAEYEKFKMLIDLEIETEMPLMYISVKISEVKGEQYRY